MTAIAPSSANWRCRKCGRLWAVPGLHPDCDGEDFVPVRPFAVSPSVPLLRLEQRRPDQDPGLWRRLMSAFARNWRHYRETDQRPEAAHALELAMRCNRHAVKLETANRRDGETANRRPHEARGSAASNACFGAY